MGIRERRKRDEDKMRERILKAAMSLFSRGGVANVTMRRIAARIEYSPGAIYRYFNNKNELLRALSHQGFEMLLAEMSFGSEGQDPHDRLVEGCRAYVRFALDYPDYYELMFSTEEIDIPEKPNLEGAPMRTYNQVLDVVRQCMEQGSLYGESPDAVAVSLWSSMHGLSSLLVKRQFKFIAEDQVESIVAGAFDFVLRRREHNAAGGTAAELPEKVLHQG